MIPIHRRNLAGCRNGFVRLQQSLPQSLI
jgi:hypothetical protein